MWPLANDPCDSPLIGGNPFSFAASGLYYIAEIVEEYPKPAKSFITYSIWVCRNCCSCPFRSSCSFIVDPNLCASSALSVTAWILSLF